MTPTLIVLGLVLLSQIAILWLLLKRRDRVSISSGKPETSLIALAEPTARPDRSTLYLIERKVGDKVLHVWSGRSKTIKDRLWEQINRRQDGLYTLFEDGVQVDTVTVNHKAAQATG
jgi:hypothetical protein